jgi:sugar phosphate isomerase/epimerase
VEKGAKAKFVKGLPEEAFGDCGQTASRRAFLKSAMLTAAAAGSGLVASVAPRPNELPTRKNRIVVGAHLWVYAAKQPGHDATPVLEQVFADISYAGLDGVELMHNTLMHDDAVERIGGLSRKYKLPVIGTSFGGEMWNREAHTAILKEAEVFLPRLARVGGRTLGISVGRAPQTKTLGQLDAQAEMVRKLRALAQNHGVVLNLHNHTYEVENAEHDLRGTLARIPDVKLGPDLNWLLRAGVDPVNFIKRYGPHIVFLHLRDQKADGKWSEALGEGDMDYVGIGRALREINFRGDAVIELAHEQGFQLTRPLRESLKMSREFVRQALGF